MQTHPTSASAPPESGAQPKPIAASSPAHLIARSVGSGVAIAAMTALAGYSEMPLMLVPFATSIVLVMGSPEAAPAQPRALIGGHLIATAVGLAVVLVCGPHIWAAAVGVALATAAMHVTRTFHPPAGIDPLVVVTGNVSPWFLLTPVAAGAVLLALFAYLWHRAFRSGSWPQRPW